MENLPTTWPGVFAFAIDRMPQIVTAIAAAVIAILQVRIRAVGIETKKLVEGGVAGVDKVIEQTNGHQMRTEQIIKAISEERDAALTENRALRGEKNIEEHK